MLHRTSMRAIAGTAALAGLIAIAASGRADAQITGTGGSILTGTGGTTGNETFATADFVIAVQQTAGQTLNTSGFFDLARCNCATPISIVIALTSTGLAKRATFTGTTGQITFWLGNSCDNVYLRPTTCLNLGEGEPLLTFLNQEQSTINTDAKTLSRYLGTSTTDGGTVVTGAAPPCTSPVDGGFTQNIYADIDYEGTGSNVDLAVIAPIVVDLSPPPAPTGVKILGGNEALVVSWTAIDASLANDLLGYQILCSRADQYRVFKENGTDGGARGPFDASFLTCPATQTNTGVEGLDPTFVCSPLLSADATSYRIETLQNDITYAAAVVAIDTSGNPSPAIVGYGTPVKTLSFYDVYRNGNADASASDPGAAAGGFCALAAAAPPRPESQAALVLSASGVAAAVACRRRKRRR
jgi:hypothetical protein